MSICRRATRSQLQVLKLVGPQDRVGGLVAITTYLRPSKVTNTACREISFTYCQNHPNTKDLSMNRRTGSSLGPMSHDREIWNFLFLELPAGHNFGGSDKWSVSDVLDKTFPCETLWQNWHQQEHLLGEWGKPRLEALLHLPKTLQPHSPGEWESLSNWCFFIGTEEHFH